MKEVVESVCEVKAMLELGEFVLRKVIVVKWSGLTDSSGFNGAGWGWMTFW